ncbi:MAG: protein kinase domain-containing protein [Thermoguttaceae bacterium]
MEPQLHDDAFSASLSRSLRANRICDQFEAAWKAGTRPKIDEFLTGIPQAEWPDLLRELLILDLHYRRQAGENPTLEAYRGEYPALQLDQFASLYPETSQPAPPNPEGETVPFTSSESDAQAPRSELPRIRYLGDYELVEEIARGGMGVVYKARQISLNRIVAVKMILAGQLATKADRDRFHSEAQAAAFLDHPNIVPIFEVGEHEGQHYFSMGYVDGQSLAIRLAEGPLPPKEAAELVATVAEAVEYAHRQGVIHRDIKPSNILVDCNGRPRITDFGLAKRVDSGSDLTATGQVLGTPSYMAPEQAAGQIRAIGPATDVYALGALLYSALTGRPPFQAATALETMQQVLDREPVALRQINAAVPRDLETICLECLEKSPGKRYATAAALGEDLDRYLNDRPIQARPAGMIEKAFRWYRRRPVSGTMAATLALLFIAVPLLLAGLWQEADARAQIETVGHQKETETRQKIEALERERTRQLFRAYINEAAARRTSHRVGRLFDAIDRIVAARDLADELELPKEDYVGLRSEAISALSLTDMRGTTNRLGWVLRSCPPDPHQFRYASGRDCYLDWEKPTGLFVRRIGDNSIVQRIPDVQPEQDWPKISPDNRYVSILSNDKLVLWKVEGVTPKVIARRDSVDFVEFATDRPELIMLTPQHEILIQPIEGEGTSKTLRIPEIQEKPLPPHWHFLASAGRRVAVSGAKRVTIVDLDAGKATAVCRLPGLVSPVDESMAWSPDGATLAVACGEDTIVFYQPANQSRRIVKGPSGGALWVRFDPTGRYLLSSSVAAGIGILFDVSNGSETLRFNNAELATRAPAYAGPRVADWWQAALDPPHRFITSFLSEDGLPGELGASAIHPKGRLLANHATKGIVLGDLVTGRRVGFLPVGSGATLRFDSAGNLYGFINHRPHRWPITMEGNRFTIGRPERLDLPAIQGSNLDISSDGRFVAQSIFLGSIVLDRQTGKATPLQPQQDVRYTAVHPNGSLAASFSWNAKGFRLWELASGKLIHAYDEGTIVGGDFTPDGKYLITRAIGIPDILLWSVPDCRLVRTLGSFAGWFAISPDSRYIVASEPAGKLRLNRIDNGEMIARFDAPGEDYVVDIYFSPDGRYLFGRNLERTKYHVWDLWKLRRQLRELNLDWETTPAPAADASPAPITVEIAEAAPKSSTKNK